MFLCKKVEKKTEFLENFKTAIGSTVKSISNIDNIATEISTEIIKQIINTEANKSNVSAIVNDIAKREMKKHI